MSLLIVGASARSTAHSALRAGLSPLACDLFADRDLVAACPEGRATRIDSAAYPSGFQAALCGDRTGPWMYAGALENHPDLLDRMAARRPLWGIAGASLRAVRDSFRLADLLKGQGLLAPEAAESPEGLPRDGSWLVKPRRSAGGRAIRPLIDGAEPPGRESLYQQRIEGPSLAALFVGIEGRSALLGVTRQILGRAGEPFAYAGSLGPWPVGEAMRRELERIGTALVQGCGLRGLFGVDLIARADGRPVVVEVNPRYTASVEVLELALGRSLLAEHRRAFDSADWPPVPTPDRPPGFVGKAILFADRHSALPAIDRWRPRRFEPFAVPPLADIPPIGARFEPGEPVLTVLARGPTLDACRDRLSRRLARWRGRLVPPPESR